MVRVLVSCECSGVVRDAFRRRGFDAVSCDIKPSESPGPHYQGDVFDIIGDGWDAMIAHPPCTYLCVSGLHWNKRRPWRTLLTEEAVVFAKRIWESQVKRVCMENPVGLLSSRIGRPSQYVQPYEFGDDASKKTGLWLRGLPNLIGTSYVQPRIVNGKKRWANQTDSGQNNLPPSPGRAASRSKTYAGIAEAMADQWSKCLLASA